MLKPLMISVMLMTAPAQAYVGTEDRRAAEAELDAGRLGTMADRALEQIVVRAQDVLAEHGHRELGDRFAREWGERFRGTLGAYDLRDGMTPEDVGDHAPISSWLAIWYYALESALGVEVMELTHLRDLWVLDFTIPVVLNPHADTEWCREQLSRLPGDSCQREYLRHFSGTRWGDDNDAGADDQYAHDGFAPVVIYWTVWAGCEAATWGLGWALVCAPAAYLSERVDERRIAPRISDWIWTRYN